MHISWIGQTCIKIQTKNDEKDALIVFNPYKPKVGNFPRSFTPDIALFSAGDKESVTLSQDPFIINTPGEFELKNIVIYSIPNTEKGTIFKLSTEEMTIVYLGNITEKPKKKVMDKILEPDILILPVGGNGKYINPQIAAELVSEIEPRIIFPIGRKCDTDPDVESVSKFIAEVGIKPEDKSSKVIIKKKDLPQEDTRLIVLTKE